MAKQLIIVESPTKAKTLTRFLGTKYTIEASFGHIRDLPKSKMGVNEETFDVDYVVPKDKSKRVNDLKKLSASASKVILATDPDREGEAIAWHILQLLQEGEEKGKGKKKTVTKKEISYERIVFHEITEHAIKEALESPRKIDVALVDAQQARRVLDRLVGYKLSPLLWRKVRVGLSAGRVQSVAVRLVVEREREIEAFKSQEYWSIDALFTVPAIKTKQKQFLASLFKINDKKFTIKDKEEADSHVANINKGTFTVSSVNKKEVRKYASPPFTTSTLQQNASSKLGFSTKRTMMLAQNLYEQGLITYMRTDSVNLSEESLQATRTFISSEYGKQYVPEKPKYFKTKSKVAQEAHEAIRPSNVAKTPALLGESLERDQLRLYSLIWNRMVACQMKEAIYDQTTIDISNQRITKDEVPNYLFRAVGRIIKYDGWLKVYGIETELEEPVEKKDDAEDEGNVKENMLLPEVSQGQDLTLSKVLPEQHFTQPPPRYTEAALVKALEERGIGRPSTYAPTISTIMDRKYVEKEAKALKPTPIGIAVNDFLVANFESVLSYSFTADLEQELDDVANGDLQWKPLIKQFYDPFKQKVENTQETAERVKVATEDTGELCPDCGNPLIVRFGRFGKFISCSTYPECKFTKPLVNKLEGVFCPKDNGQVIMRKTKKGRSFYGCQNYPNCDWSSWTKPTNETASD